MGIEGPPPPTTERENQTSREALSFEKKPDFLVSPFKETSTIQGIPEITAYTDTHHNSRQLGRRGYEGLASGKRLFGGLSKIKGIRDAARQIDVMARVALHAIRPSVNKRHEEGGVIINMGDTLDAVEASSVFSSYSTIERYQKQRLRDVGILDPRVAFLQLDGNHYAFNGPETMVDYKPMLKTHRTLDKETFAGIASDIKAGRSWQEMLHKWDETHGRNNRELIAIHPVQKWFMEKLYFGSQVGRFVERDEDGKVTAQAAVINSVISRPTPGFRREDLDTALAEIGVSEEEPLGKEMIEMYNNEVSKNREVEQEVLRDALTGAKTVVYTHNAEGLQPQLTELLRTDPELQELVNNLGMSGREEDFIVENVTIYGGHLHLAERDFGKRKKGTVSIRGMTRSFVGPVRQRPVPKSLSEAGEILRAEPYELEIDTPEVLVGNALYPERRSIEGVNEEYKRLLKAAQAMGTQPEKTD